MDWNWNYQLGAPKSWICSSCGRSFAPHVSECPYCNDKKVVYRSGTSINDNEWWQKYLKPSQTGTPVSDNPSITIATATSNPNTKVTAWNSTTTCGQKCEECDKYEKSCFGGVETISNKAIISHRKPLDIHYSSNVDLNIAPCNECAKDWLEAFNEQFK